MDSLGRRVYGVDSKTYERELRDYFDKNFEDRKEKQPRQRSSPAQPSEPQDNIVKKASDIADGGITLITQLSAVVRFLLMVVSFYMLFVAGKKLYEELEKGSASGDDEQEGDVFDKMFGSEFKGKFKNARQNKGIYKRRQEELRLINLKDDSNTPSPQEVRKLLSSDTRLRQILEKLVVCTPEQYEAGVFIQELGQCATVQVFFRVTYRGYTFRELLSPKLLKRELLREAAGYVLSCLNVSS
jgi:hypothetical protein